MSGLKYWTYYSGRKVVFGLLIGFGILFMVLAQILVVRFSAAGFVIGICLALAGLMGLVAGHPSRRTAPGGELAVHGAHVKPRDVTWTRGSRRQVSPATPGQDNR